MNVLIILAFCVYLAIIKTKNRTLNSYQHRLWKELFYSHEAFVWVESQGYK